MINPKARRLVASARLATALLLAVVWLTAASCGIVHKSVAVEKLLAPLSDADTPQLVSEVNRLVAARSIHAKVDIQFEDTSFATSGIAEKYRTAEGSITLQRPAKVYLVVQGPFATDVAQMTSDGEHFRIAILKGDEKYHRFVRGTNQAIYAKLETSGDGGEVKKGKPDTEAQTVNALSNLRPQHLTDALMIRPIDLHAAGLIYAQSEIYQSEKDPAPQSTKRIVRGYYLLDELQPDDNGSARLLRRFWFDRVSGIRLARQQTFNEKGTLITDVSYGESKKFGDSNALMPVQVGLTRPQDHYKITITYQAPETVSVDRDYPPEVFLLENKWGLREVDLDAEKKPTPTKN
jgi:hypothetical protein